MKNDHHVGRLVSSLIACFIPGYVALYLFTYAIPGWYSGLKKPDFLPSDLMLFYGIILLFGLLGLSLYSLWNAGTNHSEVRAGIQFFIYTLTLLMLWFVSFFFLEAAFFALVVMVMVIAMLLCTLAQILRSAVTAAFFMVPTLILLLIICYTNLLIVELNAGLPMWGIIP